MDLHRKYGLRRVINAYDKATHLAGARVSPDIAETVAASLGDCYHLAELQDAAGRAIAGATGAEWGCVTACAAAGITLSVAAAMTGRDKAKVARLPDTEGMSDRVVIQRGHCISFGVPVTQMIRLAGARVIEAGTDDACSAQQIQRALVRDDVAAVFAVESYHTSRYDGVPLPDLADIAHHVGIPFLLDAATQELRLRELVASGADLVVCSAHKYLGATTAGVVAGRRDLVEALLLQNGGIGRGMKVGKEGIFGVLAAFESPMWKDPDTWTAQENRKVRRIVDALKDLPGLQVSTDPDPNGCPFLRVRLVPNPKESGHSAESLLNKLRDGEPSIVLRRYGFDPESLYINTTEMTDDDLTILCDSVRTVVSG